MGKYTFTTPTEAEYHKKYDTLVENIFTNPRKTNVLVPVQDHPNLPGINITPINKNGRVLYHGLMGYEAKGPSYIPIFSAESEVQPSYGKYFELISIPISEIVELITANSSAKGLILDVFTLNMAIEGDSLELIRENLADKDYQVSLNVSVSSAAAKIMEQNNSENKMHKFTKQFVDYCKTKYNDELNVADERSYCYNSLPICIIDCVYSLRAKYNSVTVPIVERYAQKYMNGDKTRSSKDDNLSQFIANLTNPGLSEFADNVAKNHQILGRRGVPKEKVCLDIATTLQNLGIETLEDFQKYPSRSQLVEAIESVNGIGAAGVNYLFMLTGDDNKSKPDVHIHQCITEACGEDVSDSDCQKIIEESAAILKSNYPNLTVRKLDGIIWRDFSSRK